jgi:flavin reductase (DIM6/NTAB) family NADH-FMN oxidoreductase RutF
MKIELSNWHKLLAPRAVVLISTVNKEGISNAAPFSFIMPASVEPPMIAFASDPEYHTISNIRKTGNFAVNIPGVDMLNQLWICGKDFPKGVSEIKKAHLTEKKSKKIKSPKVAEALAQLECKIEAMYRAGDHIIVVGRIVDVELKRGLLVKGKYDSLKARSLLHVGGNEFTLPEKIIKPR